MTERAVAIKFTVKDQEQVLAALRAVGREGEISADRLERSFKRASLGGEGTKKSVDEVTRALSQLGGPAATAAGHFDTLGGGMSRVGLAATALGATIGALTIYLAGAAREFAEIERRQLRTEAVLTATGQAAGRTKRQVLDLVDAIDRSTLFDDKDILSAAGALLTFKSVAGETFDRTLKLAADLAEVMGTDVKSAALQLGKALEDPERGLTALTRSGVSFSEVQKEQIKLLIQAGKEAEAFGIILATVEGQVGGAATRAAEGLAGSLDRVGKGWQDIKKAAGEGIAELESTTGVLDAIARLLQHVADKGELATARLAALRQQAIALRALGSFVNAFLPGLGDAALGPAQEDTRRTAAEIEARGNADQLRRRHQEADAEAARVAAAYERAEERRRTANKKSATEAAKTHEQLLKDIEKLEAAATIKSAETKEQQIDRAARVELDKWQRLLNEKKISLAEFARAEVAIATKAEAEKAEIARDALNKWLDDQVRLHERAAKEALRPWQNFGDDLANILARGLENGFASFDFSDLRRSVLRFAGGLANQQIFNPLLSGVGLAQPVAGAQDSPLFGLGRQLSSLGGGLTVFGQPLFGSGLSGTAGEQELVQRAAQSAGVPVPGGVGLVGNALGGAATGLGIGSLAGLIPGLNAQNAQIGGALGGALGAAIGSIIPGVGTVIGGLIGSVLGSGGGGLFGPKKPSVGPNSTAALLVGEGGALRVVGTGADNGGSVDSALALGRAFATALGRLTDTLGLRIAPHLNMAGAESGLGRVMGFQAGTFGGQFNLGFFGNEVSGTDAEDVIKRMLFRVLKSPRTGGFESMSADVAKAIANSNAADLEGLLADIEFAENLRDVVDGLAAVGDELKRVEVAAREAARAQVKGITDFVDKANELGFEAEGQQALDTLVGQLLDFSSDAEEITETAKALAALAATFDVVRDNAEKLGLTEAQIADAEARARDELRQGFDEGIAQQILQLTDPVAAALAEFDRAAARRVKEAQELGADLVDVERLNALERQRVIEQAANASRSSLAGFFDEVMFGALGGASPGVSLEGRRASFEAAAAQALAGDFSAQGRLPELGRAFLEASRSFNASGEGFQGDRQRVLDVVGALLGTADNPVVTAINENAAEDRRLFLELLEETAALRARITDMAADIASLRARNDRLAA